jgi:hypothetical protein
MVTADTLVWSEGMADWQKAGDIPGLFPGHSGPPAVPGSQRSLAGTGGAGGGSLSVDLPLWSFLGRSLCDHLRSRSEPSWATEATSVPSCLKIMPRVRPRPPCAPGESWA